MEIENRYKVVFRSSTVVDDKVIKAPNIVQAAIQARMITEDQGSLYHNWSVYSITLV